MRTPVILVNFKTYREALGPKAVALARACAEVGDRLGASIVVAPAATDVARVAHEVRIPVFAQHVDAVEAGARTGWLPPEAALEAGAAGTLLNHSERKVPLKELESLVPRCASLGLEVVVCAGDLHEVGTAAIVHRLIRVPDGTLRILVQGVSRIRLERRIQDLKFNFTTFVAASRPRR